MTNPLQTFLQNILTLLNGAAVVGITLACVYCGFLFWTAHDSPDGMGKAKLMLRNIIIGGLIIFGVNLIVPAIQAAAGAGGG